MTATCRNCATPLAGRWCHACGQDGIDPVHDAKLLVGELADAVWGWDSRLLRSLRLLFSAPGALTEAFVEGRRASFVGPLRLYLFISAAFFATYSLTPDPVIAGIAGLGDLEQGWRLIALIAHWLPMTMIAIIPAIALALHALFRTPPRGFVAHLVFTLHFGIASFLTLTVAQLVGVGLRGIGAGISGASALLILAHGHNAAHLWFAARRVYGLPIAATLWRLVLGILATVVVMAAAGGLTIQLSAR